VFSLCTFYTHARKGARFFLRIYIRWCNHGICEVPGGAGLTFLKKSDFLSDGLPSLRQDLCVGNNIARFGEDQTFRPCIPPRRAQPARFYCYIRYMKLENFFELRVSRIRCTRSTVMRSRFGSRMLAKNGAVTLLLHAPMKRVLSESFDLHVREWIVKCNRVSLLAVLSNVRDIFCSHSQPFARRLLRVASLFYPSAVRSIK